MKTLPIGMKNEVVVQETKDETLLYDLRTNKAVCLNKTSAMIWKHCDGETGISEIARKMGEQLGKPVTKDIVWLALSQLDEEGLLESEEKIESRFEGLSRREVIRKVGMASMVALPIVSSIAAPTSIQAQSCGGTVNVAPGGGSCQLDAAACTAFSCRCTGGIGATFTAGQPPCGPAPAGTCICN